MNAMSSLALVWIAVLIANVLARYTRLTPVLCFLFCGAFMVNTGLLPEHADPFLEGLSELGIIIIMFAIGFEEDTSDFVDSIKKSWGIAFFGALFPFLAAYSVAEYFWHSTPISLMCGLTMTATAVAVMTTAIFVSQIASASIAARYTGGMNWNGSIMVGLGMLGRAELAFVVMDIAYVQNHILPTEAFYTLMISAFFLNLAVPIAIRIWKPRYCAALVEAHDDPELTRAGNPSHVHENGHKYDSRSSP